MLDNAAVVQSLSVAANPATAEIRGDATLQYCCGKGDWKFKKEWLREKKDYSRLSFCRRCNCGPGPAEHWLDFLHLSFNQPEMVSENLSGNVPENLPFRGKRFHMWIVYKHKQAHALCSDCRFSLPFHMPCAVSIPGSDAWKAGIWTWRPRTYYMYCGLEPHEIPSAVSLWKLLIGALVFSSLAHTMWHWHRF